MQATSTQPQCEPSNGAPSWPGVIFEDGGYAIVTARVTAFQLQ